MLGYLSLEVGRTDVNGLKPGMSNDADGHTYPVKHLSATHIPNPNWDPDHSSTATDKQINGGKMNGFAGRPRSRPRTTSLSRPPSAAPAPPARWR
jgi:phospholipase C